MDSEEKTKKAIKEVIIGLTLAGLLLFIVAKNTGVDVAKYWTAAVTQLTLVIQPNPVPEVVPPIVAAPSGGGGGGGGVTVPAAAVVKCKRADLNCDGRISLVDFSIAAFWYKRVLSTEFAAIEVERLNGDRKIDLVDFSIMAYYWTG